SDIVIGGTATTTSPVFFSLSGVNASSNRLILGQNQNMDVVIGNTTSSGLNSAFQLSGNDLFVQGNIGSASSVYTNGAFVAGTDSTLYGDGFITRTSGDLAFTTGGTGNLVFNTDSDSNIRVSSTAPGNGTNVMAISNTGASNSFNLVDLNMAVGAGDAGVDTNVALNINVPGPAESGDVVYGIQISAAAASAGTLNGLRIDGVSAGAGTQDAISIGGSWDSEIRFFGTTPVLRMADSSTFDITDGTNNLWTLTDLGTAGQITVGGGIFTNVTSTNATSTNLAFTSASGSSLLLNTLTVGGQSVCLANGGNCPAGFTTDLNWSYSIANDLVYNATATTDIVFGSTTSTNAPVFFSLTGTSASSNRLII
ncbi:MAG: hypothetical protein AAB386_00635, partial [Patescibacteria group bacterium]